MDHMFIILSLIFEIINKAQPQFGCSESVTTVSGTHAPKGKICSGELIFEDNFDMLDLSKWQHEQTLGGGGNWEFQWYTNNRSVSFTRNGILHIKPRLLSEEKGENFLSSGTLDINGGSPADECTNPAWYGCLRVGTPQNLLNPIKSARIRSLNSFRFKYGKLEAKMKLPAGDWLWPAFWLLPLNNQYGGWPSSGEIDIVESRGNRDLKAGGKNIGTKLASGTLHWGPSVNSNKYSLTHFEQTNPNGFHQSYHLYQMDWTPENITFKIDNRIIGTVNPSDGGFWELGKFNTTKLNNPWISGTKMAPFDQEFYIVFNLAVGGISFFPDDAQNNGGKPWSNKSPTAIREFWEGRRQWLPTWNMNTDDQALKIDYVRVWAL